MTHLPYIIAAYALAIVVPAALAVDAVLRVGRARRTLAAVDPRLESRS